MVVVPDASASALRRSIDVARKVDVTGGTGAGLTVVK